jgi:hypothetical protein
MVWTPSPEIFPQAKLRELPVDERRQRAAFAAETLAPRARASARIHSDETIGLDDHQQRALGSEQRCLRPSIRKLTARHRQSRRRR